MEWRVEWKGRALKALNRLDKRARERIVSAVEQLAATGHGDVKKLRGDPGYRLRVGAWRVVFDRDHGRLTILVLRVGARGDVYKK